MRNSLLALLGLLLLPAAPAESAPAWYRGGFSGKEILDHCKESLNTDPVKDFNRGICIGFIEGFTAGHFVAETYHAFHHRDEKLEEIYGQLCVPENTSRGQMARTFVQYLQSHPDKLQLPAALLIEDALRETYPCPK
jgi:hypothetical protein